MKITFLSCYSLDLIPNAIISVKCYALIEIPKLKIICFFAAVANYGQEKGFQGFLRLDLKLL